MGYLETLDMARDIQIAEVASDHVRFSLTVRGALESFKQAIQFGETLAPLTESQTPASPMMEDGDTAGTVDDRAGARSTLLSYRLLP